MNTCKITLATYVTMFRMILVVPFIYFLGKSPLIADAIFVIAWASDVLDGYLARSRNEVSDLGAFLDPIADKMMVDVGLIWAATLGIFPVSMVSFFIIRDLIVDGARLLAAEYKIVIAANWFGKIKTGAINIAMIIVIFMVGYGEIFGLFVVQAICVVLAISFATLSGCSYVCQAFGLSKK